MKDELHVYLVHGLFTPETWSWTVWCPDQDKIIAAGYADSEERAEFAADSVARLMEMAT